MTATVEAPARADLVDMVIVRALAVWRGSDESRAQVDGPDDMTRQQARDLCLTGIAEAQRLIRELELVQDYLAEEAARHGATHEQRGVAVGLGKESARRRWPWRAAK